MAKNRKQRRAYENCGSYRANNRNLVREAREAKRIIISYKNI